MAVEIEAKIRVASLEGTRDWLQKCQATLLGKYREINTFFDTEDRSLIAADKGLRLRVSHDPERNTNECVLTFKGPRQPGQYKSREETEVRVGSPYGTMQLLQALGFTQVISFEKRRESWKLKNCKVELDEVPFLGCFVEIEGPSEAAIAEVQRMLGLFGQPTVRAGYAGMLTTYLEEIGSGERVIVFPAQGGPKPVGNVNGSVN